MLRQLSLLDWHTRERSFLDQYRGVYDHHGLGPYMAAWVQICLQQMDPPIPAPKTVSRF